MFNKLLKVWHKFCVYGYSWNLKYMFNLGQDLTRWDPVFNSVDLFSSNWNVFVSHELEFLPRSDIHSKRKLPPFPSSYACETKSEQGKSECGTTWFIVGSAARGPQLEKSRPMRPRNRFANDWTQCSSANIRPKCWCFPTSAPPFVAPFASNLRTASGLTDSKL